LIPGKQYSFDTVVDIARRRKWLVLLPAIVIGAAGAAIVQRLPNAYRAEASVLVVPQQVPQNYVRATVTTRIEDRLQTISQQIMSRTRLEQIVTDFNLYPQERADQELMEDIVERMRTKDIGIDIVKGNAFRVSYTAADPRTAQRVTERLASLFIDESLRDREVLAEGTSQFLATQLDEMRRQLVLNEQKLQDYQALHTGEMPSQMTANLQGMHNAEMALQTLSESLNRDRERRLLLERSVADIVEAPEAPAPPNPGTSAAPVKTVADELRDAEQALLALELKLKPEHPDVRRQRRSVEELKTRVAAQQLEGELVKPRAPAALDYARRKRLTDAKAELDNLDRQLAVKTAEESRLRGQLAMYQSRIDAAPAREAELASITRDYETLQQSYRVLLQKKEESQLSANLERRQIGEQFKILDPARLPEKPFSPDRPALYLLTLIAALGVGAALAATAEYFDRSLRTEADVRAALNLMVLATVPDMGATAGRGRRQLALGMGAVTVLTVCAAVAWRLLR
jgi:polysaccharide chain length determinant protein (PEP-CTERM system associated)